MNAPAPVDPRSPFPLNGGDCAAILRGLDWSAHPLGDPSSWPAELTTAVRIALTSRFATMVHWGKQLFTFYNDAYAARLGRKHPGHLGQPAFDWWSEMWDQIEPFFSRVLQGETFFTEDARYTPDRDGEPREAYFTHSHSPLWDPVGKVAGIFVVVTETTRQVLAEKGRASDELQNRQVVDSAIDVAIIATDLEGRVTRWNQGALNIIGWTEEEMKGQTVERLLTPEDRVGDKPAAEMRRAFEEGYSNECWHLRKSGERFWAQVKMTPLEAPDGRVSGLVIVLSDRTEERLSELRSNLLSRASAGLLSASDPEKLIEEILRSGAEALGYDQSYSYLLSEGCTRMHLMHAVNVDPVIEAWLQDVAAAEVPLCGLVAQQRSPLVLHGIASSDDPRTLLSRSHGVRAYAGYPVLSGDRLYGVLSFVSLHHDRFEAETLVFFEALARFLSIGRDRLEREAALTDLAMTLEQRVDQRTRELVASEEALRQSQKMDAVGQLTGGVAHDFNNLLTVIRGSVDLLRRTRAYPERQDRYIDAIASTTERAAKLTNQLLAFARRQTLRPEVFDVALRLRSVVEMLDAITGARIRVLLEVPPQVCWVKADASQFETALVNMAVNARDAMDGEGELRIVLSRKYGMPAIRGHASIDAAFVAVSLQDTGVGIAPENMARIFEPFYTTKEVGKGTGLGLSQVFGFAKQSGGDVEVRSAPGGGSTFTLYLPEAGGPLDGGRPDSSAPVVEQDRPRLRVLVVEDNVEVGQFCTQVLQEFGHLTTLVSSAESALARLAQDSTGFDVVFSDVVMPGIGGLELAKKLRVKSPTVPVVLASGYSHVLAQEGSHGFPLLRKPYSAEELLSTLHAAVMRKRGQALALPGATT